MGASRPGRAPWLARRRTPAPPAPGARGCGGARERFAPLREVEVPLGRQADLVDRDDVRVLELARDLRFLHEALDPGWGLIAENHLHGHGPSNVVVGDPHGRRDRHPGIED